MGSNIFINYSLGLVNSLYRVFGIKLTNFIINNTVGQLMTSGESLSSLMKDINDF
jgi:hypothetical protein